MSVPIALKVTRAYPDGTKETVVIGRFEATGQTCGPWEAPPRSRLASDVYGIEIGKTIMRELSSPNLFAVASIEVVSTSMSKHSDIRRAISLIPFEGEHDQS